MSFCWIINPPEQVFGCIRQAQTPEQKIHELRRFRQAQPPLIKKYKNNKVVDVMGDIKRNA